MEIIREFIEALEYEIEGQKRGQANNNVTVYNGKFLRQTLNLFIYQFNLDNIITVLEGTPALIEINETDYDCEIISVNGQQVQVGLKEQLSKFLPVAKIKTNTWYLLEILKKKYEENIENSKRFEKSQKLFSGTFEKIEGGGFHPSYSIASNTPNESQNRAIVSSLNDFISIIWGPPGTGKTVTIAKAIESHLNLGRKVLLLSHSNNAVDQALEKVADQTRSSYYKECQLVRLGTPKAEKLQLFESEWSLVLIDKIVAHKSTELIRKKNQISNQVQQVQSTIKRYKKALAIWSQIKNYDIEIKELRPKFEATQNQQRNLGRKAFFIKKKINEQNTKLKKAKTASNLKRIVLGLNLEKLSKSINELALQLNLTNNEINKSKRTLVEIKKAIIQRHEVLKNKYAEFQKLLSGEETISQVNKKINELNNLQKSLLLKIDEIEKEIESIRSKVLVDARLVATTLTKSYISKELEKIDFDILIVDEVSMALLPMLYWAASKVKKGITLVGDFKQLPPIVIADEKITRKWLKRNIFNLLGLDSVSKATTDKVNLLDIQYRMNPLISEIPRTRIYENKLKDARGTEKKIVTDAISANVPICLIDTTPHSPWCSQLDYGRFNLISALICVTLAERILNSFPNGDSSIGIITPYRSQARLILKIAEDKKLLDANNLRINTVHSFQGGEETVIIFDCVEGLGARKWSMINEFNNAEAAKLLLNVAFTRAESKLYLVANNDFLNELFPSNSLLIETLNHFKQKGQIKLSTEFFNNFKDENFEYWIENINSLKHSHRNQEDSYSETEFWPAFINDLKFSKTELVIFSPFLTTIRVGKLQYFFRELIAKGTKIYVITLPSNHQPKVMRNDSIEAIKYLKKLGVSVKFRGSMHEKIALIDRRVKWVGSLNILSHNDKHEYMERVVGENTIKELYDKFDLDTLLSDSNIVGNPCPLPGCDGFIALKKQRRKSHRKFYGCTNYPKCNWTQNVEKNYSRRKQSKKQKQTDSAYSQ